MLHVLEQVYKISEAAFFESTSRQLSLYIIWFRVSPKRKYYFKSETDLKPSQISKMKFLAKGVNASRDIFRTVKQLKAVNFFHKKSSIMDILLGPENASGFTVSNYIHQKLHLISLRRRICPCIYLVWQNMLWRNSKQFQ